MTEEDFQVHAAEVFPAESAAMTSRSVELVEPLSAESDQLAVQNWFRLKNAHAWGRPLTDSLYGKEQREHSAELLICASLKEERESYGLNFMNGVKWWQNLTTSSWRHTHTHHNTHTHTHFYDSVFSQPIGAHLNEAGFFLMYQCLSSSLLFRSGGF